MNLAIHKATITDDGGTVTATQANMNGIHDQDESTNVVEIATNNTLYLHYDLGAAYQIGQLRIYASTINTAYWLVQCSNNDADWTTESLATTGSCVYSDIDDGYRYLRIRCDTTGIAAISLREHVIDADATLMKYQAGSSSSAIGFGTDTGTWQPYGETPYGGWFVIVDTEHPATADGYLVALKYIKKGTMYGSYTYVYILRDLGTSWRVIDKSSYYLYYDPTARALVIDPPLKFKTGDIIAIQAMFSATDYPAWRGDAEAGKSFMYFSRETAYSVADEIAKSDYTTKVDWEFKAYSYSHADIPIGSGDDRRGSLYIPIADRSLTGLAGDSTDPRVVNVDIVDGVNPEIDFYGVVSSLASGISDVDTSLTLHDASDFPQAAAGADYGGRVLIDTEKIDYTYISGNVMCGLTRGVDGSSAAAHSAWDIVKDITKWIEISVDDSTFKKPGDAGLPLSLGATIVAGANKTFYVRANVVYEYQDDKQIYSRIHVLWAV